MVKGIGNFRNFPYVNDLAAVRPWFASFNTALSSFGKDGWSDCQLDSASLISVFQFVFRFVSRKTINLCNSMWASNTHSAECPYSNVWMMNMISLTWGKKLINFRDERFSVIGISSAWTVWWFVPHNFWNSAQKEA